MTPIEQILRRDRLITAACLLVICLLSWYYLLAGAGTGMSTLAMSSWQFPLPALQPSSSPWSLSYWLIMLVMWWVMMIAMMIPSAAPAILLYGRVRRHNLRRSGADTAMIPTGFFFCGYLLAWLLFSVLATALQWGLEQLGLLHSMMMWSRSNQLSGALLIAAGLYQWTPLKRACLRHCRTPASFLAGRWRTGRLGALTMGLEHGFYCVGCCWVLMLLLFVGGTMNLVWIAGLAAFVLVEKLLPGGDRIAALAGIVMIAAGIYLLLA